MKNYVIHFGSLYFFNAGVIKKTPDFFTRQEAVKNLHLANKYMKDKPLSDSFKPRIRLIKQKKPLIFARKELNIQGALFSHMTKPNHKQTGKTPFSISNSLFPEEQKGKPHQCSICKIWRYDNIRVGDSSVYLCAKHFNLMTK
jgi:hypothetical protein